MNVTTPNECAPGSASAPSFKRVIWIILDGVGAGEAPDANIYGDSGSNTLKNTAEAFLKKEGRTLKLPNLAKLGLGHLTLIPGCPIRIHPEGAYGTAMEQSKGKDTLSGHWEMAGVIVEKPFETFPQGFPDALIDAWVKENNLPGILGNKVASGTDILEELGAEHQASGKPIVYTSADSVFQIAAHEETFGLERLIEISKSARKLCDEYGISRVIARPFIGGGSTGKPYSRTYNRKDLAVEPLKKTYLEHLTDQGHSVTGIGKISSIYNGRGISTSIETHGNTHGLEVLMEQMSKQETGLIYVNLIDFDMLYGHRRDVVGFGKALEEIDLFLGHSLLSALHADDLLLINADHGNDPTYPGTDHTRERIPFLAHSPKWKARTYPLGLRKTFADAGASVYHGLTGKLSMPEGLAGKSILPEWGFYS